MPGESAEAMQVARPESRVTSLHEAIAIPSTLKVTVPVGVPAPDITVAVKLTFCPPSESGGVTESPVVVDALAIWNERATSFAASWFESPPCDAVTVHPPAPLMCTLELETEHWPAVVKLNGRPEDADAFRPKSASP